MRWWLFGFWLRLYIAVAFPPCGSASITSRSLFIAFDTSYPTLPLDIRISLTDIHVTHLQVIQPVLVFGAFLRCLFLPLTRSFLSTGMVSLTDRNVPQSGFCVDSYSVALRAVLCGYTMGMVECSSEIREVRFEGLRSYWSVRTT